MTVTEQLLREWLTWIKRPGDLYISSMVEVPGMADMIRVAVNFPAIDPANDDVESLEFSYAVDGGEATIEELPKEIATKQYVFPQDSSVHLELTYVDDAGNRSPASKRDFIAADTVPPGPPGDLEIEVLGEE